MQEEVSSPPPLPTQPVRQYVLKQRPRVSGDLSVAKIKRFKQCPEKYRRIYRDHDYEPSQEDQDVGKLGHQVIEIEANTRIAEGRLAELVEPEQLLETLEYAVQALEDVASPAVIERTADFLEACAHKIDLSYAVAVEEPFSVDIGNGKTFCGIVDLRRQRSEDEVRLVDWKTGGFSLTQDEIRHDAQAVTYLWAARRLWPKANKISITMEYLARDITSSLAWTPELDRAAGLHLLDMAARISSEYVRERAFMAQSYKTQSLADEDPSIWPAKVGSVCADCGFRASCKPYEEWVSQHGRKPTLPLEGLPIERLGEEAIVSRTLATVHEARKKDAYARIWEHMGKERKLRIGSFDFFVKRRPERKDPSKTEVLDILQTAGFDLDKAMSVIGTYVDWPKVKALLATLPKPVRMEVKAELDERVEIINTNSHLEAHEAGDNPFV